MVEHNEKHNPILCIIAPIIVAIVILIVSFMAMGKVDQYLALTEKGLKIQAVDQCEKVALVTWQNVKDNTSGTQVNGDIFSQCMKDKGY